MSYHRQQAFLRRLFDTAVAAVNPTLCLPSHLKGSLADGGHGRTVVVGAGKAAAAMARAVEDHWLGDPTRLSGLVIARYGHGVPTRIIEVVEAAHPVPDLAGQMATSRILAAMQGLTADDQVLVLLSGGGSALLAAPLAGISLAEKQALTAQLLACGARISEMNCVRKHLSAIKGGRLALAAAPARVLTLAISDVPGDDLSVIASGPTVPDASTCADALEIAACYEIALPDSVRSAWLADAAETPKPGASEFGRCEARVIASSQSALLAAAAFAQAQGIQPLILSDAIEGEACEVARVLAGVAVSCARYGHPVQPPCVLLSGGETTVSMSHPAHAAARGGRNTEFLLGLALALDAHPAIYGLACDTDGIDGTEDNAGAIVLPDTLARARLAGIDVQARLRNHAAYSVFADLDDLVVSGPTRTNVNDFRALLIEAHA